MLAILLCYANLKYIRFMNPIIEQLSIDKAQPRVSYFWKCFLSLQSTKKFTPDSFPFQEFIMFADADAGKLYQIELDSKNVQRLFAVPFDSTVKISRPVALDYDHVEDRVYWSDGTLHTICRAFRNGTGFEVLFSEDIEVAEGLTIDFAARQLYWTSTMKIETSRLDGTLRKTLVTRNLDEPRDIIVDPVDG